MNKLRLLRMCKVLCSPSVALDITTGLVSTSPCDSIMYGIFGFKRSRTSILDLLTPGSSIITKAQVKVFELLSSWTTDEGNLWYPLFVVGGDFANPAIRMRARAQLLQMSAGILDAFELQLARPPFNLVAFCLDLAPSIVRKVLDEFLAIPEACLPVGIVRLKRMFEGAGGAFPQLVAPVLRSWAASAFVAIDLSERNHNRMRNDLMSSGPGRSPTLSSNRVFNREVLAAHEARGGSSLGQQPRAECARQGGSRQGLGGNPRMQFSNARRKAYKALHAPDRPLTMEERRLCEREISDAWLAMGAEDREDWAAMHCAAAIGRHGECVGRTSALVATGDAQERSEASFRGLWGLGDDKSMLAPTDHLLRHGLLARGSRALDHLVWQDDSINVQTAPDRVAHCARGWGNGLDGCMNQRKNICRHHSLSPSGAADLDRFTKLLCTLVDKLGKNVVREVATLVRFVGYEREGQNDNEAVCYLAILVDARYSPKMQYFAMCEACGVGPCFNADKELPFYATISRRSPRLPGNEGMEVGDDSLWGVLILVRRRPHSQPLLGAFTSIYDSQASEQRQRYIAEASARRPSFRTMLASSFACRSTSRAPPPPTPSLASCFTRLSAP